MYTFFVQHSLFSCRAVCLNVSTLDAQRSTSQQGAGSTVTQSTAGTGGTSAVFFSGQGNTSARPMVRSVHAQCSDRSDTRTESLSIR